MPEFRVPTRTGHTAVADPTGAAAVGDELVDEPTHSVSVEGLLEEDANAAQAVDVAQERFDRAELVKTVRMDAFDRAEVESGAVRSWEITTVLDDQRYAPDVLILPPRVLTRKWQDGAVVRPNGASAAAEPAEPPEQDRSEIAKTVRTSPLPEIAQASEAHIELDSEAIVFDDIPDIKSPPPPKPRATLPPVVAGSPAAPELSPAPGRPGRARRNTGPLQQPDATPSPQSQQDDDDLSGIVQELLEEKKAKVEPKKKAAPKRDEKRINWFNDVFTEEYFRTLPKDFHKQTERDVRFIHQSLGLQKGARLLDLACGFGRHAVELAQRDYEIAGLDVSMSMLQRALSEAQRRGLSIKFVHGDMRELNFNGIFDACFCWQTSFGYFDDRTNVQVAQGVARALKPGGRFLLDVVNRDYVASEMPSRTWWEGHECVFLEEVEFDNHFSVLHTKRSFIYEDGSPPREFSSYIRLYSLHELRQLLHFAGFRVLEVSGGIHHRGSFLGPTSPRVIVLAEKVVKDA